MPIHTDVISRIMRFAQEAAALHRYPFPERVPLWEARLRLNEAELNVIAGLEEDQACHYMPRRGPLRSGGIPPDPDTPGIAQIAGAARDGRVPAPEAALQSLAEARQRPELNAFTALASEKDIATQLGDMQGGERSGPLFGVPVVVKDLMAVRGFRQTGGSGLTPSAPCSDDAQAVERLRRAGALMVGTANLHELAYGITSVNPHFGRVLNPRWPDSIPGGSSGGSAAAVAAGFVPAALGTDTAGSIRIPAACCGVVGFKPSYDAVPRLGAMDLGPSLDHIGPIARAVDDAALLFSVMAGQEAQVPRRLGDLRGVRIGLPRRYFFEPLADDVERALRAAIAALEGDGAVFQEAAVPGVERASALQYATLCSEATAVHWRRLVDAPDSLGEDVRVRLEIGQLLPALWYTRAQGARERLAAAMDAAMANVDVLLTPTLRTTAPRVAQSTVDIGGMTLPLHAAVTSLTLPFNLTGQPAISLPCGWGIGGLPVSLQLAGRVSDDWHLLAVAKRVEEVLRAAVLTKASPG